MSEFVIRFVLGGVVVSLFAAIGDLFRPRTFAGLFGAAPSIALATLALAVHKEGASYAAIESKSMLLGAIGLLAYAAAVRWFVLNRRTGIFLTAASALPVWFGCAFGLWAICLR